MSGPFDELEPALGYHLVNTLGWRDLRPIQRDAIRPVQHGDNALLLAPTAGGKTEAAVLPILSRMATERWEGLSVLYLCPLRALLNNLEPRLAQYAAFLGRRAALWHGDVNAAARRRLLEEPPDLLLSTPESLEAILISPGIDHTRLLHGVRAVLIDELHAFAGDDRGWHVIFLLERLERLAGRQIQRVGLTATVGNPESLLAWLSRGRGGVVLGPASIPAEAEVTADYVGSTANVVEVLSKIYRGERRLVFADSRARVENLAAGLRDAGIKTFVSHGSLAADERRQAEAAFGAEPDCAIVATSTLELGLDVGDLDRVIQVGAPPSVASFLQRMGRTGRRPGTSRNCLFLATDDEELLAALAIASLWREGVVECATPPLRPAHLYAQQVMALILQEGGVARPDLRRWLGSALESVPEADRAAVLRHMLETGMLAEDAGVLGMGPKGERVFGRRHFRDLLAAFSAPLSLTVHYGAVELGSVHPSSLALPMRREALVLLLAGRSWKVADIDWRRRRVAVVPVAGGGRARWLGSARRMPAAICRAAERLLAGGGPGCTLSRRAAERLAMLRERLAFVDGQSLPLVTDAAGHVRIWTFRGGLASAAIAQALASRHLVPVAWDEFSLTVRAADPEQVAAALATIDPDAAHPPLPADLGAALKFGACLPLRITEAVLHARTVVRHELAEILSRPVRILRHQQASNQGPASPRAAARR